MAYQENQLQDISRQFQIYGEILHAETCKIGHINETYSATYDQGGTRVEGARRNDVPQCAHVRTGQVASSQSREQKRAGDVAVNVVPHVWHRHWNGLCERQRARMARPRFSRARSAAASAPFCTLASPAGMSLRNLETAAMSFRAPSKSFPTMSATDVKYMASNFWFQADLGSAVTSASFFLAASIDSFVPMSMLSLAMPSLAGA